MRAGNLNQRIKIYQSITSKSQSGAPITTLQKLCETWSSVEQLNSDQEQNDDRSQTLSTYQFTFRYRSTVKTGDWLMWRNKLMKITSLDDSDPKRHKLLVETEINPKATPPAITE